MNRLQTSVTSLSIGLLLCIFAGCGDRKEVKIQGAVTFNGAPVEDGNIVFYPEPGTESRKASAAIVHGVFEIPADLAPSPGKFKIEISGMKKTGRKIPSADPGIEIDERVEMIPEKYNRASTLVREIASGENQLEFKLDP